MPLTAPQLLVFPLLAACTACGALAITAPAAVSFTPAAGGPVRYGAAVAAEAVGAAYICYLIDSGNNGNNGNGNNDNNLVNASCGDQTNGYQCRGGSDVIRQAGAAVVFEDRRELLTVRSILGCVEEPVAAAAPSPAPASASSNNSTTNTTASNTVSAATLSGPTTINAVFPVSTSLPGRVEVLGGRGTTGVVFAGTTVSVESAYAACLCVVQGAGGDSGADPACQTTGSADACSVGTFYAGNTTSLTIETTVEATWRIVGCAIDALTYPSSPVLSVSYTVGPIAGTSTFGTAQGAPWHQLVSPANGTTPLNSTSSTTTETPSWRVQAGTTIIATSPNSARVCLTSASLSSGSEPFDPVCAVDGSCSVGAASGVIVSAAVAPLKVKALGCGNATLFGVSSTVVAEGIFEAGVIVGAVQYKPLRGSYVVEGAIVNISAARASTLCWTEDAAVDGNAFVFCNEAGTGCNAPAVRFADRQPRVTTLNTPLVLQSKGCTDIGPTALGTSSPGLVLPASYYIGEVAAAPSFDPPGGAIVAAAQAVASDDSVFLESDRSVSICWTSHRALDTAAIVDPVCTATGDGCLVGNQGRETSADTFSVDGGDASDPVVITLRAVGCTNEADEGGTNSPVSVAMYKVVPNLLVPTFDPVPGTLFPGETGAVALSSAESVLFCYSLNPTSMASAPVIPQCSDDGLSCIAGTEVAAATSSSPASVDIEQTDMTLLAQACGATDDGGNRNSAVSAPAWYSVFTGHRPTRDALAALYAALSSDEGSQGWLTPWDLAGTPYCSASGVTCSEDGSADRVSRLSLMYNNLQGDFSQVDLLPFKDTLVELNLAGNALTGGLPESLFQLSRLETLQLFYNNLEGGLPSAVGDLTSLLVLDLDHNLLTGPIPPELGKLVNVQVLDLSWNGFTGPIPAELGDMTSLVKLDVGHNNLDGTVPAELDQLVNLRKITVSQNPELDPALSDKVCARTRACIKALESKGSRRGAKRCRGMMEVIMWAAMAAVGTALL